MRATPLRNWLPAIVWATLLLSMSGGGGASSRTESWVEHLFSGLSLEALFYINYVFRKASHVIAYGILGWLNYRGTGERRPFLAVGLAVVVAIVDEALQGTTPRRTASAADVGFDFCGAALFVALRRGWRRAE